MRPLLQLITFGFFFLASCNTEVEVPIEVSARDHQGKPLGGAVISIDGNDLGSTNIDGTWSSSVKLMSNMKQTTVEVTKSDEKYYFAPHFEKISLKENAFQKIEISAVLFSVPKPGVKLESKPIVQHTGDEDFEEATQDDTEEELAKEEPAVSTPEKPLTIPVAEEKPTEKPVVAKKKEEPKPKPEFIYTIHTMSGKKKVPGVRVQLSMGTSTKAKDVCTSNKRGRCVIRLKDAPDKPVQLIFKSAQYKTKKITRKLTNKGTFRAKLVPGSTIDIIASLNRFAFTSGIEGIDVFVDGKKQGQTDEEGRFSYSYKGKKEDLIEVTLYSKEYLPHKFQTDYIVSGEMTLRKAFTPKLAPHANLAILRTRTAGTMGSQNSPKVFTKYDDQIRSAVTNHLLSTPTFNEITNTELDRLIASKGLTVTDLIEGGWAETDLTQSIDALVLPTLIFDGETKVQLSIFDSNGKIIAAAKHPVAKLNSATSINKTLKEAASKLVKNFPFEGSVLSNKDGNVKINIGLNGNRGIRRGEFLDVYGLAVAKKGNRKTHKKVATLRVNIVDEESSQCSIVSIEPRALIQQGDLVRIKRQATKKSPQLASKQSQIKIYQADSGTKRITISNANIYFKEKWIGSTDSLGSISLSKKLGKGKLKVIKHGYAPYSKVVNLAKNPKLTIRLSQETAYLKVETSPPGANISVDGNFIGKSPLYYPMAIPSGFVSLEIGGITGYKDMKQILELEKGTLELTGLQQVVLEKDHLKTAQTFLKSNRVNEALDAINQVPDSHSDFLSAMHLGGEIYLTKLDKPSMAADFFSKVTSNPAVKTFVDKRFIGTHINEGLALFFTAENLQKKDPKAASAHYSKAIQVLEKAGPFLRFIPQAQFDEASQNVFFYSSLSKHRLWQLTKDQLLLEEAVASWKDFLENKTSTLGEKSDKTTFTKNARIYLKQAEAMSANSRNSNKL